MEAQGTAVCCEALLEQVIRLYLEIEMHYQTMQNDLSANSTLQAMQTVGNINTLLHEAQAIDSLVADALNNAPGLSASLSTLLEKRGELLNKIYQRNSNITLRAKNVQSLLRHEITSLSTSHKAISGYRAPGTDRKNIICAAF